MIVTQSKRSDVGDQVVKFSNSNLYGEWFVGNNATSMNTVSGLYLGTVLTTDSTHSKSIDQYGPYYEAVTSALAGNNAGHAFSFTNNSLALNLPAMHKVSVLFDRVTNMRCFIGLSASTTLASGIDADNLSVNSFGLQFSTARGDTTWQLVSYNGSQSRVSSTIAPVAGEKVEAIFWWTSSSTVNVVIKQYSAAATKVIYNGQITSNLLTGTTALSPNFGVESTSAATISMKCYGVKSEYLNV